MKLFTIVLYICQLGGDEERVPLFVQCQSEAEACRFGLDWAKLHLICAIGVAEVHEFAYEQFFGRERGGPDDLIITDGPNPDESYYWIDIEYIEEVAGFEMVVYRPNADPNWSNLLVKADPQNPEGWIVEKKEWRASVGVPFG